MGESVTVEGPGASMAASPRPRSSLLLLAVAMLGSPGLVSADVTVGASRSETIYSAASSMDCAKLHPMKDEELPLNVVRLKAMVPGVPDEQVSFRWSVLKPAVGVLIADQDISGGESKPVIEGICGQFGTEGGACVLSGDRLRFYTMPSVLWVAPTCDILPDNTGKQFGGGLARFKVTARMGKRKLGKGKVSVGFGRVAAITLFADEQNGIGKPSGVSGGVRFIFSANTNPNGQALPDLDHYEFTNGAGAAADAEAGCDVRFADQRPFDVCTGADGELDYHAGGTGRHLATVKEVFKDGSALCDNITVQVLACAARGRLEVSRQPRVRTYTPGSPRTGTVNVTVRLRNESIAEHGLPACPFLLAENVLNCSEEAAFSGGSEVKGTSLTLEQLGIPTGFTLPPGGSIVLLRKNMPLINVLPDTASLTDAWTATSVNAGNFDASDAYRIKGRPGVPAP